MTHEALRTAAKLAVEYLAGIDEGPVFPAQGPAELRAKLDQSLPDDGSDPVSVIEEIARQVVPGLVRSQGGRYFGFVTGGALPVGVAADWLTSAKRSPSFRNRRSPAAGW